MTYDITDCDAQGLLIVTHADYLAAKSDPLVFSYRAGANGSLRCVYVISAETGGQSDIPPPSLQSRDVIRMYAERDDWTCHLCGGAIDPLARGTLAASPDHLVPRINGGDDYPANLRTSHLGCNKGRRDRVLTHGAFHESLTEDAGSYPVVTPDRNRKGREGKGTRGAIHACNPTSANSRPVDNGTAAATPDRHAWMALRAIGGGW